MKRTWWSLQPLVTQICLVTIWSVKISNTNQARKLVWNKWNENGAVEIYHLKSFLPPQVSDLQVNTRSVLRKAVTLWILLVYEILTAEYLPPAHTSIHLLPQKCSSWIWTIQINRLQTESKTFCYKGFHYSNVSFIMTVCRLSHPLYKFVSCNW